MFAIPLPSCPKRLPELFFGQTRARPSRTRTQCVAEHEALGVVHWAAHLLVTLASLTDVIKDIQIVIVVVIALSLGYCVWSTAGSRGSFRRRSHPAEMDDSSTDTSERFRASRPKSALHLVSYRWNYHFTDTAGGLTIPATIDTTSSVEHSFHHRCRWNYYSSDDHYRLISGVIIPATPTLD